MTKSNTTVVECWVEGVAASGFPLCALPYGVIKTHEQPHVVVAIGNYSLDLAGVARAGLLRVKGFNSATLAAPTLNLLMSHSPTVLHELRGRIRELLSDTGLRHKTEGFLIPTRKVELLCPLAPGDFIDFYSSYHHAARSMAAAGALEVEPAPNWHSLPVGYHSRTSTIMGSGQKIERPIGQRWTKSGPELAPSTSLDFELEVAYVAGGPTSRNEHFPPERFEERIFGIVLLNDWSARDLQAWEANPLGPLLSKSFASQVGSWVLPLEALSAARVTTPTQTTALAYLTHDELWGLDINLEAAIETSTMRATNQPASVVTRTNLKHMTWNGAQQVSHATVNGAAVRPGDLFGTGTVSGPEPESAGCMLERTQAGRVPLQLSNGEIRRWLENGDRITLSGTTYGSNGETISLGHVWGEVAANRALGEVRKSENDP